MRTVWYFPLEKIPSRYTTQLSERWIPDAFHEYMDGRPDVRFVPLWPDHDEEQIKVGAVLDAVRRSRFSFSQVAMFLHEIEAGNVKSGDAIYLQDFWTPGFEAIPYALALHRITDVKIYSTWWAQSVDEYDFMYPMREWARPVEIGFSNAHAGIFVASTILKDQMRAAGVTAPIHVTSLPIDPKEVSERMPDETKQKLVVFSSRLHHEKQPMFMLDVALAWLAKNRDWLWVVTTSCASAEAATNVDGFLARAKKVEDLTGGRFHIAAGLTKAAYYGYLKRAAIQFNSSLQDYVAWTMLEAALAGCDLCYPDFRSFPECVPADRLYKPFDVDSALEVLERCVIDPHTHEQAGEIGNRGRLLIPAIVIDGADRELSVWEG